MTVRGWLPFVALALSGCATDKGPPVPYIVNVTPPAFDPSKASYPPERYYAAKYPEAFRKCMACHTSARGAPNGIGPNLWGVFGKPAASRPGYRSSEQLKAEADRGLVWNEETLDRWLTNPRAMVPGAKMTLSGIADPQDRKALIAYLARLR